MQALLWYLPELRRKLKELDAHKGPSEPLECIERVESVGVLPALPEVKLSRAERRRADRENKKR